MISLNPCAPDEKKLKKIKHLSQTKTNWSRRVKINSPKNKPKTIPNPLLRLLDLFDAIISTKTGILEDFGNAQ